MRQNVVTAVCVVVLVLLQSASVSLASAGKQQPVREKLAHSMFEEEDDVENYIPVQGKITDSGGNPLIGDYVITFRLYDVLTGGTALCYDTNTVTVVDGLFTSKIWGDCADNITGQQLYLGIEVAGDSEMTPRQPIYAVPYAWSLRPNATIIGTVGPGAILNIENWDTVGRGLRSYAMAETGTNYGVVGASRSPDGYGGYFYNNYSGTALRADSNTGIAIKATGTGIIQSSALSYVWISGNGVRPYDHEDTTEIDMTNTGGARITCGTGVENKNVMLPITVPGPLYGQDVTVTDLDLYFVTSTEFDGIQAVLLRRQTGMCHTSDCYVSIIDDHVYKTCDDTITPDGCTLHWDLSANNILTDESGILYLTIEFAFGGTTGWIEIGGARLTLSHD